MIQRGAAYLSIVVEIIDTFPTRDILAEGRIRLHSLLVVSSVTLKIDDESERYFVEFPLNEDGQALIELCDKTIKEKVHDAMVFKYEEYIKSLDFNNTSDSMPYIYKLEKERIERKSMRNY